MDSTQIFTSNTSNSRKSLFGNNREEVLVLKIEGAKISGKGYVCNEEGKIKRLQGNFMVPEFNDYIVGTAVFCSFNKQGDLQSLTEEQIKQSMNYVNNYGLVVGQDINKDYETLSIQARKKMKQLMGAME